MGQYGLEHGACLGLFLVLMCDSFFEVKGRGTEVEASMVNIIAEAEAHWKAVGKAIGEELGETRGIIAAGMELGAPADRIVAQLMHNMNLTEPQARRRYREFLEEQDENAAANGPLRATSAAGSEK